MFELLLLLDAFGYGRYSELEETKIFLMNYHFEVEWLCWLLLQHFQAAMYTVLQAEASLAWLTATQKWISIFFCYEFSHTKNKFKTFKVLLLKVTNKFDTVILNSSTEMLTGPPMLYLHSCYCKYFLPQFLSNSENSKISVWSWWPLVFVILLPMSSS